MASNLTVVLTSGGIDSAVAAALVKRDGGRLALLHLEYGQQAAQREQEAFGSLCDWLKPAQSKVASLGEWGDLSASPLVAARADMEDAPAVGSFLASTFVPMLSPAMLCAAAGWAYTIGAGRVVWGACHDNPGNYPDRSDSVRLLCHQVAFRCLPEGKAPVLEAPLAQYNKESVLKLARELNVPVELTWSCLRGGERPCQRCIGCAARAKAQRLAGAVRA